MKVVLSLKVNRRQSERRDDGNGTLRPMPEVDL